MTCKVDPNSITEIVAIDGPAGAGKSSVARMASAKLRFAFLDTGAMYRAATWRALHHNVDLDDPDALLESTQAMRLEIDERPDKQHVRVDGIDVTSEIRSRDVTSKIFKLDRSPGVRDIMVDLQRTFGMRRPTLAEGRDIGTIVFPMAKCKIYMDASIQERVRRRANELASNGIEFDPVTLANEIEERDHRDMTRDIAPLRRADDAILLDTTSKSLDEVVDEIVALAHARIG
jgi:cytidylate kinase